MCQCQAGVILGDGEGTHTPYSFFQCRILIDTGGGGGGGQQVCKMVNALPWKTEGLGRRLVCVQVCVDIWERMVLYSAEWIII